MKFQLVIIVFAALFLPSQIVNGNDLQFLKRGERIYPEAIKKEKIHFKLNTYRDTRYISPLIYGETATGGVQKPSIQNSFVCICGREFSTYNWETNATDSRNIGGRKTQLLPGGDKPGGYILTQLSKHMNEGKTILLTLPALGHVIKDAKIVNGQTGNQSLSKFHRSAIVKESLLKFEPDLKDSTVYQDEFIHWVENKASQPFGGKIYYKLDYRPESWRDNFPAIQKERLRYDEIVQMSVDYFKAVKELAPEALTFGPGIEGLRSLKDLKGAPDYFRGYFLDYYLKKLNAASKKSRRRLLDVLDINWTPKGLSGTERIHASRAFWDPFYEVIDANGVRQRPNLIQRLQTKIDRYYPKTLIAFSEYDLGGGEDISGALATADSLGAFGKNGVYAAAMTANSKAKPYNQKVFELFQNFDKKGNGFGNISFYTHSSDPQKASIYASFSSQKPEQLTAIVINRSSESTFASFEITHDHILRKLQTYTVRKGSQKIEMGQTVPVKSRNTFKIKVHPLSVTLFHLSDKL